MKPEISASGGGSQTQGHVFGGAEPCCVYEVSGKLDPLSNAAPPVDPYFERVKGTLTSRKKNTSVFELEFVHSLAGSH
jgi:hypothetical protein